MAKKNPLLELSTDIERDFILIDGGEYPIKGYDELSLIDFHWLRNRWLKVHKLFGKDDLTDDEIDSMENTIEEFVDYVFIDPPKKLLGKLTPGHKYQIMMTFTKLFLENLPEGAKKAVEEQVQDQTKIEERPDPIEKPEETNEGSSGTH